MTTLQVSLIVVQVKAKQPRVWGRHKTSGMSTLSYASCGDSTPEIVRGLFGDPMAGSWGLLGSGLLLAKPSGAPVVRDASAVFLSCWGFAV